MAQLEVDLVDTAGAIWSGKARAVSVPASDGEMGILPGHTPVLCVLGRGAIRITTDSATGEVRRWQVDGGFMSVDDNQVTVVLDGVEAPTPAPAL